MSIACTDAGLSVGHKTLLEGVDARFLPGRVCAILGPNGAGKSTLLSLLCAQRPPTRGRVMLDDRDIGSHSPAALALRRAVMPQESSVAFDFNAEEIVALGRLPHRLAPEPQEHRIVPEAMTLTGVAGLAHRVLNTLSGGEKARVHLARALAQLWHPRPDGTTRWLMLDEPTAALDVAHQHSVMALARRWAGQGVGVVAVLHDLNLALRYADEVIVLSQGRKVAQGETAQVLQPALVSEIWRTPCELVSGRDGAPQFLFGG
ncbi:heme ABC transporter ATP-binding protein [Variovorax dokdonensis]|uniref:Heme ABC transporter ATP-binding protein n=1 Tax=Variovorax dokdonensis TaxID=344883 RepID=A0ABT7NDV8_9BURK|nr:heme ABC transporter ATP-binding protein [Variovorax dokdonensis]MDM0046139.1 heme ABC transporter ATP-binding protein [Variovorax dokdonensis]